MSGTVLVVDDEFDLLQCIVGVLEDEGYDVIATNSGPEALKALEALGEKKLAAMFVDVMMPLMTGFELVGEVRRVERFAAVPVVMMSAVEPPKTQPAVWVDFLKKPFHVDALLAVVERIAPRA